MAGRADRDRLTLRAWGFLMVVGTVVGGGVLALLILVTTLQGMKTAKDLRSLQTSGVRVNATITGFHESSGKSPVLMADFRFEPPVQVGTIKVFTGMTYAGFDQQDAKALALKRAGHVPVVYDPSDPCVWHVNFGDSVFAVSPDVAAFEGIHRLLRESPIFFAALYGIIFAAAAIQWLRGV